MTGKPPTRAGQAAGSDPNGGDLDELDLASLAEWGYARAHFGDEPVLVTPELAAEIKARREEQL